MKWEEYNGLNSPKGSHCAVYLFFHTRVEASIEQSRSCLHLLPLTFSNPDNNPFSKSIHDPVLGKYYTITHHCPISHALLRLGRFRLLTFRELSATKRVSYSKSPEDSTHIDIHKSENITIHENQWPIAESSYLG